MNANFRGVCLSLLSAALGFERDFIREEAHPEDAHPQTAEHSEEAHRAACRGGAEWIENNHRQPGQCEHTGPAELGNFHARTVELMIEKDNQQAKEDSHQLQLDSDPTAKINHQ